MRTSPEKVLLCQLSAQQVECYHNLTSCYSTTSASRCRLLEHRNNLSKVSKERQAAKDQAELLAKSTEGPRVQRADITKRTSHLKELRLDTERLRKNNDSGEI
jgi:hypothetical protein